METLPRYLEFSHKSEVLEFFYQRPLSNAAKQRYCHRYKMMALGKITLGHDSNMSFLEPYTVFIALEAVFYLLGYLNALASWRFSYWPRQISLFEL